MNLLWAVVFALGCLSVVALAASDLVIRPVRVWASGGQYVYSRPADRGHPRHRRPDRSHRAVQA